MCTIILRFGDDGALIGANRDEMLARAWDLPRDHWAELPGVVAGRDGLAGGTWLGVNGFGVMAAVLNREGTLGPAAGKRSRGELPLLALAERSAADAAAKLAAIDTGDYRSFNLVVADAGGGFLLRGLERVPASGRPDVMALAAGIWMITSGEANDVSRPRIARHLPKFRTAPAGEWAALLADNAPPADSALNIPADAAGFGTVCSSVIMLGKSGAVDWQFAAGAPHETPFKPIKLS